ncbi:circadian clock KaiB family protein [Legionella sp. D16C41]|uniref:circadian clock KaiB family protein n=1 Tax=Legionella sp. D16C41 TaxID=3402688 RepID=UPI003AF4E1D5
MAKIILKLYVIGHSPISRRAITNLKEICATSDLKDLCNVEVIDLCKHYELAEKEKILATPVLIKQAPLPQRRIIGDLADHQKVIEILEEPTSKFL